jgi:NAD(P)-dependent dehydrogenase (short-subunit alcohol dehydrogenase family)
VVGVAWARNRSEGIAWSASSGSHDVNGRTDDMKRIGIIGFYELGAKVHALLNLQENVKVTDAILVLAEADDALGTFLESEAFERAKASREVAEALTKRLEAIAIINPRLALYGMLFKTPRLVTNADVEFFRKVVPQFELLFASDSNQMDFYLVTKKGIASTSDLIERAEDDFPQDVLLHFDLHIVKEIRESGKAFAFELFTASAFHIMRAAELMILKLLSVHNLRPTKNSERNWGNYIRLLERHISPELTLFLREVAKFERNETIHPSTLLSQADREKVYTAAKPAIIGMAEHLAKHSDA